MEEDDHSGPGAVEQPQDDAGVLQQRRPFAPLARPPSRARLAKLTPFKAPSMAWSATPTMLATARRLSARAAPSLSDMAMATSAPTQSKAPRMKARKMTGQTQSGRSAMKASAASALVQQLIDRAHAAGTLRPDVTFGDVSLLLIRLGRPLPGPFPPAVVDGLARRRLALLLDAPRTNNAGPREPLPGPELALADLRSLSSTGERQVDGKPPKRAWRQGSAAR